MEEKREILSIKIDNVSFDEAMNKVWKFLNHDKLHMVFTPNSEMLMVAQKDSELKEVLNSGDLVVPDGIGVVIASKILNKPLKHRVAGFDIAKKIVSEVALKGNTLFLLGGMPGVAETAKQRLENESPGIKIVGVNDGYFSEEEEKKVIEKINSLKPDILFVCLGMSRQEKWIFKNKDKLRVRVCIGAGGTLDVFAGKAKRAPDLFCKLGLEWLYRLLKEPWRFIRMTALPKFAVFVLFIRIKMLFKGGN